MATPIAAKDKGLSASTAETSTTTSAAPSPSRSASAPNANVTYAFLACFLSSWTSSLAEKTGSSVHKDGEAGDDENPAESTVTKSSAPTHASFDYVLRICFTLALLNHRQNDQGRQAGKYRSQKDVPQAQPKLQVSEQGPDGRIILLDDYALELHLSRVHVPREADAVTGPVLEHWRLNTLLVYNEDERLALGRFPCFPLVLQVFPSPPSWAESTADSAQIHEVKEGEETEKTLVIDEETKAIYFVEQLGEPTKKGGGEVAHSGPAVWMEWEIGLRVRPKSSSKLASSESDSGVHRMLLHISLKGKGSRGPERWEKGQASECTWDDLSLQRMNVI